MAYTLVQMADIGATANGGCNRQALTDSDQQGRELFLQWCRASGYTVSDDAIGNIFVRRAGENGQSDGELTGLEVLRSLDDHNMATKSPLEVIVWTNEEGADSRQQ